MKNNGGGEEMVKQSSELLREREVTRQYPVNSAWLRKRRRLRLPPIYVRVGRMVFYCKADLEAFFAAHRGGVTPGTD